MIFDILSNSNNNNCFLMHLIIILVEKLASISKRLPTNRQTNDLKFNLSRFLKILKNFRMLVSSRDRNIVTHTGCLMMWSPWDVNFCGNFGQKWPGFINGSKFPVNFGVFEVKIGLFDFSTKICLSIFKIFWWNYGSANRFN